MPLVRIDLHEGRSEEELAAVSDAVHQAMVATIAIPAEDRFQVVTEHPRGRVVYDPGFLGVQRDDGIVVVQITLVRGRVVAKKEALYAAIAERLAQAGVEPRNVLISLVEVGREDWSFGEGVAQYAVADREAAGG
jgi:phenylpyruvate tautomerase PptA (4-oxalocrotonate tautomerase family)